MKLDDVIVGKKYEVTIKEKDGSQDVVEATGGEHEIMGKQLELSSDGKWIQCIPKWKIVEIEEKHDD